MLSLSHTNLKALLTKCLMIALATLAAVLARDTHTQKLAAAEPGVTRFDDMPNIALGGGFKIFWAIGDGAWEENRKLAWAKGFSPVVVASSYADYPGNQKEDIRKFIGKENSNPWVKPPNFERIVRRQIDAWPAGEAYVHDFEVGWQMNLDEAWRNQEARRLSGAGSPSEFEMRYLLEWASWFSKPLDWTKLARPHSVVGIYEFQPYRREVYELTKPNSAPFPFWQEAVRRIWPIMEPHLDFQVAGVYIPSDTAPDAMFYLARNIEGSVATSHEMSHGKPVYAFEWLRFHDGNKRLAGREVPEEFAEAMAILPFFLGAKGIVLWGYEPQSKTVGALPYATLAHFARSLARVAPLSERIAAGRTMIDVPAQVLWQNRQPLVRRVEVSEDECIVMAVDPWQSDGAVKNVEAMCGKTRVLLETRGRRITIVRVFGDQIREY